MNWRMGFQTVHSKSQSWHRPDPRSVLQSQIHNSF